MQYFLYYILILSVISYAIVTIDKLKSIYKGWRIPEKTLWILAIFGGVFGIWIGMSWPMYHKAGKRNFKIWIPVIAIFWIGIIFSISYSFLD